MNVRTATADDAAAIVALERQVFGADAWSSSSVEAGLGAPDRTVLVAAEGDDVRGYAIAQH